ncbi:hypothetical protein Csa_023689, partial [Cucumis sativus]
RVMKKQRKKRKKVKAQLIEMRYLQEWQQKRDCHSSKLGKRVKNQRQRIELTKSYQQLDHGRTARKQLLRLN